MPMYHMSAPGKFVPFAPTPFAGLEKDLEDWIEANPHLLLDGEPIAIIARQPSTPFGKYPDLIGIDRSGACIVIELKRGQTPRDVLAQTLEYAAWVDSLTLDDLDALAREYAIARDFADTGVADLYRRVFEPDEMLEGGERESIASRITFNNRQRLIIVAEHFSGELEQTLRYLRTRLELDITGIAFGIRRSGSETILVTEAIVGREALSSAADKAPPSALGRSRPSRPASDASLESIGGTPFVKAAVTSLPAAIESLGSPDLQVELGNGNSRFIYLRGEKLVNYWFAKGWVFCGLYAAQPEEEAHIRSRISEPSEVKPYENGIRFHLTTDQDLAILREIVATRAGIGRPVAG